MVSAVKLPPSTSTVSTLSSPAQTVSGEAVTELITGISNTSIEGVVELQPVAVFVNVKVTLPGLIPVITPPFVMVAIALLLLVQVPPVVGDNVWLSFTQISLLLGKLVMLGNALITTLLVVLGHEVDALVKVNVTLPGATGVMTPALVTVATAGLLLTQVPPVFGVKLPVSPIQICAGAVTVGAGCTVTVIVLLCLGSTQADKLDCIST